MSPPRGGSPGSLTELADIDADLLSVAYNPGQSVRVSPIFVASYLQEGLGKPAVFTLATRDMNRIAVQSLLLGAHWQGLRNVVIVRGDPIQSRDSGRVTTVSDYTTTTLLTDIARMNSARDFRGLALAAPTRFCAGATVDLSQGADREISLAVRKVNAGAEYLLAQSHFGVNDLVNLRSRMSQGPEVQIFAGVQILSHDGIYFGNVPDDIRSDLDSGRPGLDIARQLVHDLWSEGISTFYVIPTILQRGLRDYKAASELIEYIRTLPSSPSDASR